ncbi:hypothetical protein JHK85_025432 [Glycine max]|nr:hypothetical protein JHK85_025432 [Glycine max]
MVEVIRSSWVHTESVGGFPLVKLNLFGTFVELWKLALLQCFALVLCHVLCRVECLALTILLVMHVASSPALFKLLEILCNFNPSKLTLSNRSKISIRSSESSDKEIHACETNPKRNTNKIHRESWIQVSEGSNVPVTAVVKTTTRLNLLVPVLLSLIVGLCLRVVSQWMNQDPLSSILRLLSERRLCKLSGTTDQNGFFEANLFHRDYEMEISHPAMKNYTCSFNSRSLLTTMSVLATPLKLQQSL